MERQGLEGCPEPGREWVGRAGLGVCQVGARLLGGGLALPAEQPGTPADRALERHRLVDQGELTGAAPKAGSARTGAMAPASAAAAVWASADCQPSWYCSRAFSIAAASGAMIRGSCGHGER